MATQKTIKRECNRMAGYIAGVQDKESYQDGFRDGWDAALRHAEESGYLHCPSKLRVPRNRNRKKAGKVV